MMENIQKCSEFVPEKHCVRLNKKKWNDRREKRKNRDRAGCYVMQRLLYDTGFIHFFCLLLKKLTALMIH